MSVKAESPSRLNAATALGSTKEIKGDIEQSFDIKHQDGDINISNDHMDHSVLQNTDGNSNTAKSNGQKLTVNETNSESGDKPATSNGAKMADPANPGQTIEEIVVPDRSR